MSIIVLSDIHLGSVKSNYTDFSKFLDWIASLMTEAVTLNRYGKKIRLTFPEKIILLGDILELQDPKDGSIEYTVRDAFIPFGKLAILKCEKIFVLGDHDIDILDCFEKVKLKQEPRTTSMKSILNINSNFTIIERHYPEKDNESGIEGGLKLGKRSYFFLHGHVFNKEQIILVKMSRLVGESWDPLGWFQDLFNITFIKRHWRLNFVIFLALLLGGWYFFWKMAVQPSLWITLSWAAITGFFAFCSIPGIVARYQRKIDNVTRPMDKTAQQIIEDGYYQKHRDTINADVVVFGHTHFASSYELELDAGKKLFINSGCWVGKEFEFDGKQRYTNTFVYIDEGGAYILTWRGPGKIDLIEAFPAEQQ